MEQQSSEAGLRNLNPMFYWRNVMSGGNNIPYVLAVCDTTDEQLQILELANHTKANYMVENSGDCPIVGSLQANFATRNKDLYTREERDQMWKKIDVLYYKGDDLMEILPAMLSGVSVVKTLKELENVISQPFEPLTRINNFEKGKEILENSLRLC